MNGVWSADCRYVAAPSFRLSLVFLMLRYGLFKLFPLQMSPPSLGVLNEPLGKSSPMTLLWTFDRAAPGFTKCCAERSRLRLLYCYFFEARHF